MGFLDALGGGSMDFGYAQDRVKDSLLQQRRTYQELSGQIAPYATLGRESTNKLADLLGLDMPNVMRLYSDAGALQKAIEPYYASSNPRYQGKQIYMNSATGAIGEAGDIPLFKSSATGELGSLQDAAKSIYDKFANEKPQRSDQYGSLLENFTLDKYQESPNYQFNLQQGQQAVDRAAAARGNYLSPAAVQDLLGYSQNLASNEYQNSYNMDMQNRQNTYNMLMGGTATGQNATGQQIGVGQNYANAYTDLQGQLSQLNLAQQAADNQARSSAFGNLFGLATSAIPGNSLLGMGMSGLGGLFGGSGGAGISAATRGSGRFF